MGSICYASTSIAIDYLGITNDSKATSTYTLTF